MQSEGLFFISEDIGVLLWQNKIRMSSSITNTWNILNKSNMYVILQM